MQVHFPNPDEIFTEWLQSAEDTLLSKRYKNYVSKSLSISNSDTIKSSNSILFALVQIEQRPADIKSLDPIETIAIKDLRKKGPFWEFTSQIEENEWNGSPFVIKWDSIIPKECPYCSGKGYSPCTCTKGFITCNLCKGKFSIICPECNGKSKFTDTIEIKVGDTNRVRKEKIPYNCSTCYGGSKIICRSCGGVGRQVHSQCSGVAKIVCSVCKGTGKIVDLLEEPVPIKRKIIDKYFTPYEKNKKDSEHIIEILHNFKHQIPKLEISDEGFLESKRMDTFLPEISKEVDKFLKSLRKELDDVNKNPLNAFYPPLFLFPGLELNCQTSKGHKFTIVVIGDENKYKITDVNWKK